MVPADPRPHPSLGNRQPSGRVMPAPVPFSPPPVLSIERTGVSASVPNRVGAAEPTRASAQRLIRSGSVSRAYPSVHNPADVSRPARDISSPNAKTRRNETLSIHRSPIGERGPRLSYFVRAVRSGGGRSRKHASPRNSRSSSAKGHDSFGRFYINSERSATPSDVALK
jgi:hypothetical protein